MIPYLLLVLAAVGFATGRLRRETWLERQQRRNRADLRRALRRPQ